MHKITDILHQLKIPPNGVLMVHSSFKGLSRLGYRAESVVELLLSYMQKGTLLMPTMSWRSVTPQNPCFDELTTPSITGILTEIFRTKYATRRSLHPTHSVAAYGALANDMLQYHHLSDMPCGQKSPWGLLNDYNAYILFIDVDMDSCTLLHHVEQTIAPEIYLTPASEKEQYSCTDQHGKTITMYTRRTKRLLRNFMQFQDVLKKKKLLRSLYINGVLFISFQAMDLLSITINILSDNPKAIITTESGNVVDSAM